MNVGPCSQTLRITKNVKVTYDNFYTESSSFSRKRGMLGDYSVEIEGEKVSMRYRATIVDLPKKTPRIQISLQYIKVGNRKVEDWEKTVGDGVLLPDFFQRVFNDMNKQVRQEIENGERNLTADSRVSFGEEEYFYEDGYPVYFDNS